MPGVTQETLDEYNRLMQEATHRESSSVISTDTSSNGGIGNAQIVNASTTGTASNQTISTSDGGYSESAQQPTPDSVESSSDYVEGYEMTKENPEMRAPAVHPSPVLILLDPYWCLKRLVLCIFGLGEERKLKQYPVFRVFF